MRIRVASSAGSPILLAVLRGGVVGRADRASREARAALAARSTLAALVVLLGGCWSGREAPFGPMTRPGDRGPPGAHGSPGSRMAAPSPRGGSATASVRVVTFNIAGGRFGLDRVVATLRPLGADLVGLQEARGRPRGRGGDPRPAGQAERVGRALGLRSVYRAHGYGGQPTQGVALLSRWPIRSVRVEPLPPGPRRVLVARVRTPLGLVTVLVAHLRAVGAAVGARRRRYRRARRREARLLATHLRAVRGPALLLADLNASPGSAPLRRFGPPLRDACGAGGGPGARGPRRSWPSGLPLWRIDYIVTNARLRALRCRAVHTDASDHRPVWADLQRERRLSDPGRRDGGRSAHPGGRPGTPRPRIGACALRRGVGRGRRPWAGR